MFNPLNLKVAAPVRPATAAVPSPYQPMKSQVDDTIAEAYRTEITPVDQFTKNDFRFMVHAFNPVMRRSFLEHAKKNGTYDPKRDANLLDQPERLREKSIVSASIIAAEALPTFGRLLFILGFDPRDILLTSPTDAYINGKEKEILANPPGPTLTPKQLLAKTRPGDYNEVALRSEQLTIQAVAVKHMVLPDGTIDTPADADRLRAIAKHRGFPILELQEQSVLEEKPVQVGVDKEGVIKGVSLQHNGIGYSLSDFWAQRYFHNSAARDWEDISEPEYQGIRPLLESALEGRERGADFLQTIDDVMRRRFSSDPSADPDAEPVASVANTHFQKPIAVPDSAFRPVVLNRERAAA
jgi:hypothetical protein